MSKFRPESPLRRRRSSTATKEETPSLRAGGGFIKQKFSGQLKKLPAWLSITKRQKFIITAILLSAGLLAIDLIDISWRHQAIGLLAIFTYLLSVWSLIEGLSGAEWFTVLVLPTLFTAGVGLFYFLVSGSWLMRVPIVALYGLGIYALLLTENIFSVAAIRTIQLLRSAHAVGFLLTVVTAFFLYNTLLAFRLDPWLNFILAAIISLPLLIQGLWCIDLEEKIGKKVWLHSLILSLVMGEIALALSFWPVTVSVGSLGLTTGLYIVLGLAQHQLTERLFKRTIQEYIGVGVAVLIVLILTTHWGG